MSVHRVDDDSDAWTGHLALRVSNVFCLRAGAVRETNMWWGEADERRREEMTVWVGSSPRLYKTALRHVSSPLCSTAVWDSTFPEAARDSEKAQKVCSRGEDTMSGPCNVHAYERSNTHYHILHGSSE